MQIDVRQVSHPEAVRYYDTDELREHFLIERLFEPASIALTYSHLDRLVVGGVMPTETAIELESSKVIGSANFLDRRELGVINIGGSGRVVCDGAAYTLAPLEALYVGMGVKTVVFETIDASAPAKFYLNSAPAHAAHPVVHITREKANRLELGSPATSNERTLYQMIHPDICTTCQLLMGMTQLKPGSVWNTMPCHVHDRRCEAYLYFGLKPDARVFHMMGEPNETRHLVVANEQAILSPGWSIHSGAGTSNYSFIWSMAGDNQDFTDMDMIAMSDLR